MVTLYLLFTHSAFCCLMFHFPAGTQLSEITEIFQSKLGYNVP